MPSTRALDHIVHLTPPETIHDTAQQFRQLGFYVIAGGTHADGLTANSLIIFPDGPYLELISFTHPESHYPPSSPFHDARRSHPWANKGFGWVAYSFLGAPHATPTLSAILNGRLQEVGSGTRYAPEVAGGRRRPDGVELKWEITAPARWAEKEGGTRLPFFCGDVTPRELRVPTRPRSITVHPNGAQGIAFLCVLAPSSTFEAISAELIAIVGEAPIVKKYSAMTTTTTTTSEHVWLLDLPGNVTPKRHPQLVLREPDMRDEVEAHFVETHGAGLFEIGVRVDESGGKRGSSETPFGRVVWVPV
ncbi:glyoxalase-like domain-containing protein [Multifurca ochricompacta]|uniref:Glyoxalase-like domain-containing protein n=1 Tax=Multifurca ochricompacta TaxID=376703 RepID=A0AAD4LWW1_9AGAM|nr:glyoxalase-like domain-containing protein [Multifurca ochricompacta]